MRKLRLSLVIAVVLIALITAVGAALLFLLYRPLALSAALAGVSAAMFLCAEFSALSYKSDEESLTIRSGVFVRCEHILPGTSVLWHTRVSLGRHTLFTVLHTAGGRAVIFAAAEDFSGSEGGEV